MRVFLILSLVVFSSIFFLQRTKAGCTGDPDCFLAYDYGMGDPYWPACNTFTPSQNPRGETRKQQWTRLCQGTSGCRTCWWDGCPDGTFQCFGKWYDVACDAGNAGETLTCPCCNTVTCPLIVDSCTATVTANCYNSNTQLQLIWNVTSKNFTINQVEGRLDKAPTGNYYTPADGDVSADWGTATSGTNYFDIIPGISYKGRIGVYKDAPNGNKDNYICLSNASVFACGTPTPTPTPVPACAVTTTATCNASGTQITHVWSISPTPNFTVNQVEGRFNKEPMGDWPTGPGDQSLNWGTANSGTNVTTIAANSNYSTNVAVYKDPPNAGRTNFICRTNLPTINCPTPTPANNPPDCNNLQVFPTGSPADTFTKGDSITFSADGSDPNGNLQSVAFYYTMVQPSYCAPTPPWVAITPVTHSGNTYNATLNTTSLNPGQIMVVANAYDSGTPNLWCTGNPGCVGPGNCCGTTNSTRCTDCRKPVTILPACNSSFTMSASSSCNVTTLTIAGAPASHRLPTSPIPNNVISARHTGCNNLTYPSPTPPGTPISCTYTSFGSYTWTHYWREYDASSGLYSKTCTISITPTTTPTVTPPTCNGVQISITPKPVLIGSGSYAGVAYYTKPTNLITSPTPAFGEFRGCDTTPDLTIPTPAGYYRVETYDNCKTTPTPAPLPGTYSFSYSWRQLSNPSCPDIYVNCSLVTSETGSYPDGYLRTSKGDVHIGDIHNIANVSQTNFSTNSQYFSTYSLTSDDTLINNRLRGTDPNYKCNKTPTQYCSKKSFLIGSYHDQNSLPPGSDSWYDNLLAMVESKPGLDIVYSQANWNFAGRPDGQIIVMSPGSKTISAGELCRHKNIFFIDTDLNFTGNFTIDGDNGCLFIVKNKININGSVNNIGAFLIANAVNTNPNNNSNTLTITGGVITSNTDIVQNTFNRNVNGSWGINPDKPSEEFVYEGARYIHMFRDILSGSNLVGLNEPQYE